MACSGDRSPTIPNGHTSPASGTAENLPQHPSLNGDVNRSRFIVVMGVSGTGKSTLGAAISEVLGLPFVDGDDLHPVANVAKMSRGEPLDDTDRLPWLATIRRTAVARVLDQVRADYGGQVGPTAPPGDRDGGQERRPGVIVACSSLKKAYRAVLRGEVPVLEPEEDKSGFTMSVDAVSLPTYFVYLKGNRDVLMARMLNRKGHFMKAGMLESQLDALESPEGEPGVVTVPVEVSTGEQVRRVVEMFRSQGRLLRS